MKTIWKFDNDQNLKIFKSLEDIQKDYDYKKSFYDYLKSEIEAGLSLTQGEIYYLLSENEDPNAFEHTKTLVGDTFDSYLRFVSGEMVSFIDADIDDILKKKGIKGDPIHMYYSYPFNKEDVLEFIRSNDNDIIITKVVVLNSENTFPATKYYCPLLGDKENIIEGKFELPFAKILLNVLSEVSSLGFTVLYNYYKDAIYCIYPNKKGKEVLEKFKDMEENKDE